jgi:hypothetical protein
MIHRLKNERLQPIEALSEALVYRFFHPHVLGLYHALAFVAACRGRLWIRTDSVLALLDLADKTVSETFAHGYANPSAAWMGSLLRSWPASPTIGTHYSFDFLRNA